LNTEPKTDGGMLPQFHPLEAQAADKGRGTTKRVWA